MKESTVWIWGRHAVLEALRAGSVRAVLIASDRKPSPILAEIRSRARVSRVVVREVALAEMQRLAAGANTQGVAAEIIERRLDDIEEMLAQPGTVTPFLLALDQIQDPQNLGSLLRTANAAGVQGVVVPARRSAPLSGTVARVSAGAVSHVPVVEVTNLARALERVRAQGIWVIGLDSDASDAIYAADLTVPLAIVVGGEAEGLRRLVRERCDFLVRLPMAGAIESLNAAVAGSIALFEVVRQRLESASRHGPNPAEEHVSI